MADNNKTNKVTSNIGGNSNKQEVNIQDVLEDREERKAKRRAEKLARKKARSLKVVEKSHAEKILE